MSNRPTSYEPMRIEYVDPNLGPHSHRRISWVPDAECKEKFNYQYERLINERKQKADAAEARRKLQLEGGRKLPDE